jgi:phosphohistidine swiveling domain-containing protein
VKSNKNNIFEKQFPEFVKKLKVHAGRYHWIYNDYAVIHRLDWKFFLKCLREFLDERVSTKEKRAIVDVLQAKKEKRRLVKKLKLSRQFVQTINLLVAAAAWRDWRKAYNQRSSGTISLFIEEFRKRVALDKNDAEYLWWWEIEGVRKLDPQKRQLAKRRRLGFFTTGDPEKGSFLGKDGAELQAFMGKLLARGGKLQGRPAFRGFARGRVKIILSQNDFHKMKKGDVLVAPNTRPEYVPIMKIAGAIISEEGGLTCHAAIVSRELKVPAIVGVQGAIAALKDGDLVEVDAAKGVIKIIKK